MKLRGDEHTIVEVYKESVDLELHFAIQTAVNEYCQNKKTSKKAVLFTLYGLVGTYMAAMCANTKELASQLRVIEVLIPAAANKAWQKKARGNLFRDSLPDPDEIANMYQE
jgi:hypothetical protein